MLLQVRQAEASKGEAMIDQPRPREGLTDEFVRGYTKGVEDCRGSVDKIDALERELTAARAQIAQLEAERDEARAEIEEARERDRARF